MVCGLLCFAPLLNVKFLRFVHIVVYVLIALFSLLYEQTSLSTVDGHLGNS